jgi:hypothetical protein
MGVTGVTKNRQSTALMMKMVHNDCMCGLRLSKSRSIKILGILEKRCNDIIFIFFDFNGGHRNGKKSFSLAVLS